jgi:hypothetical protein
MNYARVYYPRRNSPTQLECGDLYFAQSGRPLLVFSWRRRNGERVPGECLELDPAKLRPASSNGTVYRYEESIRS